MDLVALGTAHSSLVLQLGPTRAFGWAWDGAGMGVSETSSQKPQLASDYWGTWPCSPMCC